MGETVIVPAGKEFVPTRLGNKEKLLAFEQLYNQYAPLFYGEIKRTLLKDNIAGETLNQSFLSIWNQLDTYNASKERWFIWALKIVRKVIRKKKTDMVLDEIFSCQRSSVMKANAVADILSRQPAS